VRDADAPLRVAHVITTLVAGGTERMLQRVVLATRALGVEHEVISLVDGGAVADALRAEGVVVRSLSMRRTGSLPDVSALWRLVSMLRASEADIVQAWMYHANLLAALASPMAGTGRAVWGIRAASLPAGRERRRTIALARMSALLASALARSVIVNGERARHSHIAAGYPAARMVTIPNGYDLERWRPAPEARGSVRAELGLPAGALLVGLIANFRPIKDHRTALRAVARLRQHGFDVHLLLAGVDADLHSPALAAMIREELGSPAAVSALGSRPDVPRLMAALDAVILTSIDESFPNVVAEAMATGIPVVTTDAGDVRAILGADADVVAVGDHVALSDRLTYWLTASHGAREAHGDNLRSRIADRYALDSIARQFVSHWMLLAGL
jgi:glycosyltransferase involved in cell wall biosynthesis